MQLVLPEVYERVTELLSMLTASAPVIVMATSYGTGVLFKLRHRQRATISIETGIQNGHVFPAGTSRPIRGAEVVDSADQNASQN